MFLMSNQVATGLALTLFGLGLAALLGEGYVGVSAPRTPGLDIPGLSDLPGIGPTLLQHGSAGLSLPRALRRSSGPF